MEISDFGECGAESLSGRDLGFDFLSKLSSDLNSATELYQEEGARAGAGIGVVEQSIGHGDVENLEDGFRTPTSIDRKITMIDTCPPAPRKPPPRPPNRKRKALFPADQSEMVADLTAQIKKIKPAEKARVLTAPATVV